MNIEEIACRALEEYDANGVYFPYPNDFVAVVKQIVSTIQAEQEPVAWRAINTLGEVVTNWCDGIPPKARMTDMGEVLAGTFQLAFAFPPANATPDDTSLKAAIKNGKREKLLEVAEWFDEMESYTLSGKDAVAADAIRRMAEKLK